MQMEDIYFNCLVVDCGHAAPALNKQHAAAEWQGDKTEPSPGTMFIITAGIGRN